MLPLLLLLLCAAQAAEIEASYDPVLAPDAAPKLRFVSLNHSAAVLVECEFLSNLETRRFLREPENQLAIARAIAAGTAPG